MPRLRVHKRSAQKQAFVRFSDTVSAILNRKGEKRLVWLLICVCVLIYPAIRVQRSNLINIRLAAAVDARHWFPCHV